MHTIVALSIRAIGSSLIRLNIPFLRSPDDGYRSRLLLEAGTQATITYHCRNTDLVISSYIPDSTIAPGDWPVVLGLLNLWAGLHGQLHVYLDTEHGRVVTSATIPLAAGTHHAQLDELIATATAAAAAFHDWLLPQLPTSSPLAINVEDLERLYQQDDDQTHWPV